MQSCDIFTYTENITPKISETEEIKLKADKKVKAQKEVEDVTKQLVKKKSILSEKDSETISKAFDISTDENEIAYISKVGGNIRKIDPSFDTRTYNFATLSKLFENIDEYEVIRNEVGALNHRLVKRR